MTTRASVRLRPDFTQREKQLEQHRHMRNLRGDRAFKDAMMRARRHCAESFVVGVDVRPCTELPTFVRHGDTATFARFRNNEGVHSKLTGLPVA